MKFQLLIDGKLVDGASTMDVFDPAKGESFAVCARANEGQLDAAVAAAKRAFPAWAALSHSERQRYLERVADAMQSRFEEFSALLTREQGKPLDQAQMEVGGAVAAIRYFGSLELPIEILHESAEEKILEQRTPLGVVAAIYPWNFPFLLMIMKVAPALITGNTVVAKPAPSTPLTSVLFGEVVVDILPAGVLNVIVDANDLGPALTRHPDVDKVSFTGSTATGKRVMESGAATIKRMSLELGGNDAAIILDDADVEEVAPKVFQAAMTNAGQVCVAAKRIYVPRAKYDAFCEEFARLGREAVVDDGLKKGTQIGPVQNREQYGRVLELIEDAKRQGKVIVGGSPLNRAGYFIAPTVIGDLPDNARLVREEQFGPVFPVLAYDTVDEVVARANDTEYGLACTIWTSNTDRGVEVAKRIESGLVWINRYLDLRFDVSFGGSKQSGIGPTQGPDSLKDYTQAKIISVAKTVDVHKVKEKQHLPLSA
jgi:acyl-CoA reductase-like NAD-dependent aldehyde dehydrogenase